MQERQREHPRHGEELGEESRTVRWQVSGSALDDFDVSAGTKLSDFLEERGHKGLKNKHLFLNGKQVDVDEDGNLIDDMELQDGDVLSLFEGQITKGKPRSH